MLMLYSAGWLKKYNQNLFFHGYYLYDKMTHLYEGLLSKGSPSSNFYSFEVVDLRQQSHNFKWMEISNVSQVTICFTTL